jgi:hypothetical protein
LETYKTGLLDAVFLFDQQTSDYLWGIHKAGLKTIKYKSSLDGVPIGEKEISWLSKRVSRSKS